MTSKKSLNEYLFETLDRLAAADKDSIETEMNKANSIINVSEQILLVAKMKLEIISASIDINQEFSEITTPTTGKKVELFDVDSEKNWLKDGKITSDTGLGVHTIHKNGQD